MNIKTILFISLLVILACGAPAAATPTIDVNAMETDAMASAQALATQNAPTETPLPTETPRPTDTPQPSPTPTSPPEPIVLTGTGDSIVDVPKTSDYIAIMKARHTGGSNFIVTNYNANNEQIDLLINTIGNYQGTVPLDFGDNEHTARLEIKADGPWEVQILPVLQARSEAIPGTIQGVGDDVILLNGRNPDTIKADNSQGDSNFIIVGYSDSGGELIFNEIAPYTGTALMNNNTFLLAITATGNWSLEITTR